MGIRFSCHMCNHPLHVKDYQAGKRGKCPKCQGSFRVPAKDADFSLAVEDSVAIPLTAKSNATPRTNASAIEAKPAATPPPSDQPVSMPASLLPLLDARWFVRPPSGGQYGPATTQMLLDWIGEKRVTADSLLWHDGLDTWFSARELVPEPFGGQPSGPALAPVDIPPPTVASPPANSDNQTPAPVASNKAAIAMKKKKKIKQQWMVLGFLATMALCLVIALIVILTRGS